MGCDIHPHIEIKINGKWEHYSIPNIKRNYALFARAANVRNSIGEIEPIANPRGLPKDRSVVTQLEAEEWGTDGHSHSYLGADELAKLIRFHQEQFPVYESWRAEFEQWGYLFGNGLDSFNKHREDYPKEIEDVRLVFWFED